MKYGTEECFKGSLNRRPSKGTPYELRQALFSRGFKPERIAEVWRSPKSNEVTIFIREPISRTP